MEACEGTKAFVASVTEPIDTRESYGQFVAELLVAQARMESANTSARQRRKAQEQREQGLPPTNGKRCFGYDQRYTRVVEEEAMIIREARDRESSSKRATVRGTSSTWGTSLPRSKTRLRDVGLPRSSGSFPHRLTLPRGRRPWFTQLAEMEGPCSAVPAPSLRQEPADHRERA
jgi:DNA invertase Pin-like site-specific DNA recombinase